MIKVKNEKGLTGVDLTIAVILIMILLAVILSIFYNNYLNSQATKRNAEANSFITKLFTYAESLEYEATTTTELRNYINRELAKYNVVAQDTENDIEEKLQNHSYAIYVTVTSYKDLPQNQGKDLKDYLKLIEATVSYRVGNRIEQEKISTLKIIERK